MGKTSKKLAILLILVFLTSLTFLPNGMVKAQNGTLIVPDQYPTIQAAIGNASAGDTVYVKNGIYYETELAISKPVTLTGQGPLTQIKGIERYPNNWGWPTIIITSSNVKITGFNITHSEWAIRSSYTDINAQTINISGNYFVGNQGGIYTDTPISNLCISNNTFIKSGIAMSLGEGNNYLITNNTIANCSAAVSADGVQGLTISKNTITDNSFGIGVSDVSDCNIYQNNILNSRGYAPSMPEIGFGIEFAYACKTTQIYYNNIQGNIHGINLKNIPLTDKSNLQNPGNNIFRNNFIDNDHNAFVEHQMPFKASWAKNGTAVVSWDKDGIGNYWSDYTGNGSFVIDETNIDHYPLIQQVDIRSEAPTPVGALFIPLTIGIITISIIVVLISFMLFRRHRKTVNLKQ
jgi:parallel beta-helix repeat protein